MDNVKQNASGFIGRMLNFDTMITPTIIKFIYAVTTIIGIIVGLGMIFTGFNAYYGGGIRVFMGLIVVIASPFINRIWCEGLIVIFKIHENLAKIANKDNQY